MANLFFITPNNPGTSTQGKHWFNTATGQVYAWLNDTWQPKVAGESYTFSYNYPLTVFINGIDRTQFIDNDSISFSDNLTEIINTCSFTLFDWHNIIKPNEGEEVIVYFKETPSAIPVKIFAGEITETPQSSIAPGLLKFEYDIRCSDYGKKLQKELVVESYINQYAGDIIKNLVSLYAPDFTYANVQTGIQIAFIGFNYKSLSECIREIAKLTGYDWYVDYDKDIHFFSKETNIAPYQLTENIATTGHYKDLKISVDKSQLRNNVIVRGGIYLSDLYIQERTADGVQLSFSTDYFPRTPVSVYVDTGGGYVLKTLGIDNINTSGFDFVVNYNEKVIKNLDYPMLSAGHKIKFTYKYDVQLMAQASDESSIALIQSIEGGTGIYSHIINDQTIVSIETAEARAVAELEIYANPLVSGSFQTDQNNYKSGQLLTVDMTNWGFNASYLIQKIRGKFRSDLRFQYDITFATRLKGLTQFLTDLFDAGKQIIVRENEIIHDLAKLPKETITLSAIKLYEEITPPYKWGPGITGQEGKWNEAEWY